MRTEDLLVPDEASSPPSGATSAVWAFDLGARSVLVAQRGFSGVICNEIPRLARWVGPGRRPQLVVADGMIDHLRRLERLGTDQVTVGVAVPGWFDASDRLVAVGRSTDGGSVHLRCFGTPFALAVGSTGGHGDRASRGLETVLAIDTEIGWSAALVAIGPDGAHELAAIDVTPDREIDVAAALADLVAAAGSAGAAIDRIVTVGADTADDVIAALVDSLVDDPVVQVLGTRLAVGHGALVLADPSTDAVDPLADEATAGAATSCWVVVGDTDAPLPRSAHEGARTTAPCDDAATLAVELAAGAVAVAVATLAPARPHPAVSPAPPAGPAGFWSRSGAPAVRDRDQNAGDTGWRGGERASVLADALGRVERLLSVELGAAVAVRSITALLDCDDWADPEALERSAQRLEVVARERADDVGDALLDAIAAARAALADDPGHRFAGGTIGDVSAEIRRVASNLRAVVGGVSVAERQRLVRDAVALGPSLESAVELVVESLDAAPARTGCPDSAHVGAVAVDVGVAIWDPSVRGFVLVDVADPGWTAIRVVLDR